MERTAQNTAKPGGIERREFLGLAWLTTLGVLGLGIIGVGWGFAIPHRKPGQFGSVFVVGTVDELPQAGEAPKYYPNGRFWLVNTEGGLLALYNVCTHLDCLMGWDQSTAGFTCPCHGSRFNADGTYIKGPAPRSLDRFVVLLVTPGGDVVAGTDPVTGAPVPTDVLGSSLSGNLKVVVDTGAIVKGSPAA